MPTITIVTGNPGKVKDVKALSPANFTFSWVELDLPEIQSLDLKAILTDKVKRAYEQVKTPVIVDDVSAELDSLKGLPGPFVKFFNERLGNHALLVLNGDSNGKATIRCQAAYYDGQNLVIGQGSVNGLVVPPRGDNGFGLDPIFKPDGSDKTMGEMTPEEKTRVSHRGKAFRDLIRQLEILYKKPA